MPGRGREKTGLLPPAFPCFPSLSSVYLLQSSPISCRDHNRKRHVLTFRSKLRDKEDWYKWKYVWAIFYYRRTHDGLTTTNNERSAPNRGSVDQLTHSNCNIGCENRLFSVNHVFDRQIDNTMYIVVGIACFELVRKETVLLEFTENATKRRSITFLKCNGQVVTWCW